MLSIIHTLGEAAAKLGKSLFATSQMVVDFAKKHAVNPAVQLRLKLGCYEPAAWSRQQWRYATPERIAKKRKAGRYGRALMRYFDQKTPSKGRFGGHGKARHVHA